MLKHDLLFRVFQSANMWLGTDIEYTSKSSDFELQVNGEADLFIGVPNIESVSLKCSYD
jgi:hypothetical protein